MTWRRILLTSWHRLVLKVQINKQHMQLQKHNWQTGLLLSHCIVSPKGNILKCFCFVIFMLYYMLLVQWRLMYSLPSETFIFWNIPLQWLEGNENVKWVMQVPSLVIFLYRLYIKVVIIFRTVIFRCCMPPVLIYSMQDGLWHVFAVLTKFFTLMLKNTVVIKAHFYVEKEIYSEI
jgi:hypothetical protein